MSTREVPAALLDRLIGLNDAQVQVIGWLRAHPHAHPEEAAGKMELYDALEEEYARLDALRNRYLFPEAPWTALKKTAS
jgi:hypothetical protein